MITVLATLLVLGILIFVHELGHFWAARRVGIRVLTFSLGFGPKLAGFAREGTEYKISAVPLGGYVRLAGEDVFDEGYVVKPGDYMAAPWWGRILMALAGPSANLVVAFLFLCLIGIVGIRVPDYSPQLGKVKNTALARQWDVQEGDRFTAFGGTPVATWNSMFTAWLNAEQAAPACSVALTVDRGGQIRQITVPVKQRQQWLDGFDPALSADLGEVVTGFPAYQAGLAKGDRILAIDTARVRSWDQLRSAIYRSPEHELSLLVQRGSDSFRVTIKPVAQDMPGYGRVGVIGISPPSLGSYTLRLAPHQALLLGLDNTVAMVARTYGLIFQIVAKPATARQLGGIVMMGQMAGESARRGPSDLLSLMAVLSISLFVLNLLPLPVFDGGVILFCLIEGLRRRPLPNKVQLVIQQIGIGLIAALMAFTIVNDFSRIITRRNALKRTPVEQRQ